MKIIALASYSHCTDTTKYVTCVREFFLFSVKDIFVPKPKVCPQALPGFIDLFLLPSRNTHFFLTFLEIMQAASLLNTLVSINLLVFVSTILDFFFFPSGFWLYDIYSSPTLFFHLLWFISKHFHSFFPLESFFSSSQGIHTIINL